MSFERVRVEPIHVRVPPFQLLSESIDLRGATFLWIKDLSRPDTLIDLTATEFDLLSYLVRNPGRPFSRGQLLDITQQGADGDYAAYERTIDAHVKNIRQKLGDSGRNSRFIETVHGIGYRFVPQETKP